MSIFENIKDRRIQIGMTQAELAELTGYTSKAAISQIESGKYDIPLSKVAVFAAALRTTPEKLFVPDDYSEEDLLLSRWRKADDGIKDAIRKLLDMPSREEKERSSSFIA